MVSIFGAAHSTSISIQRCSPIRSSGSRATALGHMEQLEKPVYRFNGFVREENGDIEPISVDIFAPKDSGKDDSVCLLSCPYLRTKPFLICGVDHAQALELARQYVLWCLEYGNADLVDADGAAVDLPPVPKADELGPDQVLTPPGAA